MRRARVLYSGEQTWQYGAMPQAAKLSGLGVGLRSRAASCRCNHSWGSSGTDHDDGDHRRDDDGAGDDREHDGDGSADDDPAGHRADNDNITGEQREHHADLGLGAARSRCADGDRSTRGVPHAPRWATRRPWRGAPASARRRGRKLDRAGMGARQSDGGLRRPAPRQRGAACRR
jgi:hypothetical protein